MAVLLEVLVVTIGLAAFAVLIWGAVTRSREDPGRAINANHHGLYLLVHHLISIQDHGYQPVFPDQDTVDRARALLAGYEDQLVALPPQVPPAPAREVDPG
jgi:hypothetical protein